MEQKKTHGGARANSGRLKKEEVISLIEKMDAILVPDLAWQALANLVKAKDHGAIKTWLSYRYGMPKQTVEHAGSIVIPEQPITADQAKAILDNLSKL